MKKQFWEINERRDKMKKELPFYVIRPCIKDEKK